VFRLGYNTNGLAHHRPLDALELLADLGYEGMALTPDVGGLDPFQLDRRAVAALAAASRDLGMELAIETGARFVMDGRRKHFPTLLEDDAVQRERRVDFLRRCLDLGAELGASVLSLWSGRAPDGARAEDGADSRHWDRLCAGIERVIAHAREAGLQLAFEPEPGMFVERPAGYDDLVRRLGAAGEGLGLCIDVGHLFVTGDLPVGDELRRRAPRLVHVHLDDVRGRVHEHRMFGEGELDLAETLGALLEIGFDGMGAVELSRDSHRGAQAAEEALGHLRRTLAGLT